MMTRSTKGEEVRQYFLACEKEIQTRAPAPTFERFPELRAIVQLVEATAEARLLAEVAQREAHAAKVEATEAKTLAQHAIDTQQFQTIAEYVFLNDLQRQLPTRLYHEAGLYLTDYCVRHGIPVRKIPVAGRQWESEHGYPVGTLHQILPAWMTRRFGQAELTVLPRGATR